MSGGKVSHMRENVLFSFKIIVILTLSTPSTLRHVNKNNKIENEKKIINML
jgi:hypothetical protein